MNKFFTALKQNTDDIRKKALLVVGTVAAALAAGIILNKLNDDARPVIVLEEVPRDEVVALDTAE